MTIQEVYVTARNALQAHGIEAFALEARFIVAHAKNCTIGQLVRDMGDVAEDKLIAEVTAMVNRRLLDEPLAYILGEWDFMGLPFIVSPDVLIPRDDTEILVAEALEFLATKTEKVTVLDLCSGSGCIGISLASNLENAKITLIDISVAAMDIARKNAKLNKVEDRLSFKIFDAMAKPNEGILYDAIVSNPPYIIRDEVFTLDKSVKDYEPFSALDGGDDGFSFYRSIIGNWKSSLKVGGKLLFEVGENQAEYIEKLMRDAGYYNVYSVLDTNNILRVVCGNV